MIIVGAGLAGLIAGYIFPNATIFERSPRPEQSHKALLRFRSPEVGLVTGVPFREVTVRKGLFFNGAFRPPDIGLANLYSMKVMGAVLSRSIWDLTPVQRFIAPEDFYGRMVAHCDRRIEWGAEFADTAPGRPVLSTMPLEEMARLMLREGLLPADMPEFRRAPIRVDRYRLAGVDVHQTIYFPAHDTSTYRASITGDLLIVESMLGDETLGDPVEFQDLMSVFGILRGSVEELGTNKQSFGKIAPINNRVRKELIHRLTVECGVYSVGRFGVWRNILLDDVLHDLRVVKGMIEQSDAYALGLKHSAR